MLVHSGKKEFQCFVCLKEFTYSYRLKQHKVTHTKDKFFKCDFCDKSFARKGYVKTHMLVHNGIKEH